MDISQFPPRFEIAGVVLNVFQRPSGKDKEGREYGGEWVVQLMSADHLRNGETKAVPSDLVVGKERVDADRFRTQMGKVVKLPATVYVGRNGQLAISLANAKGVTGGK